MWKSRKSIRTRNISMVNFTMIQLLPSQVCNYVIQIHISPWKDEIGLTLWTPPSHIGSNRWSPLVVCKSPTYWQTPPRSPKRTGGPIRGQDLIGGLCMKVRQVSPIPTFHGLTSSINNKFLGRRIEYNYTKFGDTPYCLDNGKEELDGLTATGRGYGCTENGK